MNRTSDDIIQAVDCLKRGGIIAYPTEAVYGLGCDPFDPEAVSRILQIKNRAIDKGFILIAANWEQIENLIEPINPQQLSRVFESWPGPVTWVFPAKPETPEWLRGKNKTLAVRISAHPTAQKLCQLFGGPIISTSANISGNPPIRDFRTVTMLFGKKIDFIINEKVGDQNQPTQMRDAITGETIR